MAFFVATPFPQRLRQIRHVRFHIAFVVRDACAIDTRRPLVRRRFRPGAPEIPGEPHFINQAVPYASFHALFKGCQHAIRPDTGFRPTPSRAPRAVRFDFSGLVSLGGHYRR